MVEKKPRSNKKKRYRKKKQLKIREHPVCGFCGAKLRKVHYAENTLVFSYVCDNCGANWQYWNFRHWGVKNEKRKNSE